MYHKTTLKKLMGEELPNLTFQRKLSYVTDVREVKAIYRLLNKEVFENRLKMPQIEVRHRLQGTWGYCVGLEMPFNNKKSNCAIIMSARWYCKQWLIMAVAHEMCHQYEWDIISKRRIAIGLPPVMAHGPTFYMWRDKLKSKGIPLKRHSCHKKWFTTQRLFKC